MGEERRKGGVRLMERGRKRENLLLVGFRMGEREVECLTRMVNANALHQCHYHELCMQYTIKTIKQLFL